VRMLLAPFYASRTKYSYFLFTRDGNAIDQVGLSTLKILLQITRPKTVMLGKIPGTDIYRNLDQYKEAVRIPGFLILSIEAPINFANITYLNERLVSPL